MAVYTYLSNENINNIALLSGIKFKTNSLECIKNGSTDSCFYLRDIRDVKYFIKVHEDQSKSPHGLNLDLKYMIEFTNYLSECNSLFETLIILPPYKWLDKKSYGAIDIIDSNFPKKKMVSIWPYVNPVHPMDMDQLGNLNIKTIKQAGRATAELHNASGNFVPSKINLFPRDIYDTYNTLKKIDFKSEATFNLVKRNLEYNNSPYRDNPETFFKALSNRVIDCLDRWIEEDLSNTLTKGYIHGEIKPSNTLIGDQDRMVFIDICKSGQSAYTLELGMASQNFTNSEQIYLSGIESFIESYLSVKRNYLRDELRLIPLMIKVSAIRLAVYRTFAVAKGFGGAKSLHAPLNICSQLDEAEDRLIETLLS